MPKKKSQSQRYVPLGSCCTNDITPGNVIDGVHLQMFHEKTRSAQVSKEKEIASTMFSTNSSSTPLGNATDHQDHIKIMEEEQDEMRRDHSMHFTDMYWCAVKVSSRSDVECVIRAGGRWK